MDIKKVLLISLIAVAVVASVSVVSAGLFDGLFGEEQKDNVIEIDHISFNTTNVTKFKLHDKNKVAAGYYKWFMDENKTGYNLHIWNLSKGFNDPDNNFDWKASLKYVKDDVNNAPSQTIDGVVIYTITADTGKHVGEPRYATFIENADEYTIVKLSSPDPNETAKMASTLKFK